MGMDAELLAIGKFSPDIRDCLDYPPDFYKDVPVGAIVITLVGNCVTTSQSETLAEVLGISPWAFHEHCEISGENVDAGLLEECFEGGAEDAIDFIRLRSKGFKFYYLPNG